MLLLALAAHSRLFLVWVEVFIILLVLIIIVLLKVFEITLSWVAALVLIIVVLVDVLVLMLVLMLIFVLILLVSLFFPKLVYILYVRQLLRQTWWLLRVIQIRIFKNLLDCDSLLRIEGKHFFK